MFEPRMTQFELAWRELAWAVSPQRTAILTLGQRVRRALGWFVLGALVVANAAIWYAHRYPGDVVATDARLEDQSERFVVYSLGIEHRGVEVRCLLKINRELYGFTVSC